MQMIDRPSRLQRIYIQLTQWFNTTFIGILVGVMTSAAVNILTGEKHLSLFFAGTVILYLILCIALYYMLLFRQELDENEATRKEIEPDEEKRWRNSCRWDEKNFVLRFYKIFIVFTVTLVGAIWLNVNANDEGFKNNEKDAQAVSLKMDTINMNQREINKFILFQNKKIETLNLLQDSILKLLKKKSFIIPEKRASSYKRPIRH